MGLDNATPEELEALQKENERILATKRKGTAIASMPLPGPLRNPGFEVVPWRARPEIENKLGQWCPRHLHQYTEKEMEESHYPHASRDANGNLDKFCWACGRPCRFDGLSGKGHKGSGKPCPACGFRRKKELHPNQAAALKKGQALLKEARAQGYEGREMWAKVAEMAPREGIAEEKRQERALEIQRGGGARPKSLTDLMRMKAEARAESLLRPYFEALDLEVREDWSPSTKLEFYNGQTAIAEKLLNRIEGLPVARHRNVDVNDEDVIPEGELSPRVVARLVAAIVAGTSEDLQIDAIEDATFEELPDA